MLLLDYKVYKSLPENKRVLHLLQWLQNLPKTIDAAEKAELKGNQKALVSQLQSLIHEALGPPLRCSLGQAFVALYGAGETMSMHETIGKCCDTLKGKEDSTSAVKSSKLCALECLGCIYENQGRMVGVAFPETVQVLTKLWKIQDYRSEIMEVFMRILKGLGPSSSSAHKDIYKCVKSGLGDRSMTVRSASAKCALELAQNSTFLYTSEFDSLSNSCLRALDGSSYNTRCFIAKLFGSILSLSQKPLPRNMKGRLKLPSLDEALGVLSNGFVRGGSGFLKAGGTDLLKSGTASRECRVGVTQAYVIFLTEMGGGWVEHHLSIVTQHILSLLSNAKATSTHIDAVYSRKCVSFILRSVFGQLLGESAQYIAVKHLCQFIIQGMSSVGGSGGTVSSRGSLLASKGQRTEDRPQEDGGGVGATNEKESRDKSSSQQHHMMICAIHEIGALVYNLNTAALPLIAADATGGGGGDGGGGGGGRGGKDPPLFSALNHILVMPQLAARLAGAWCLRSISLALPSQLYFLVSHCLSQLRDPKKQTQVAVSGYCYAVSALLGTVRSSKLGLPSAKAREVFNLGQEFVKMGKNAREEENKMALVYINGGWALIGAFITLGTVHVKSHLRPLLTLWRNSFPHSVKEMNKELSEGTLDSWLVVLDNRAGALSVISSFLRSCGDLLTPELIRRLMLPLDSALAQIAGLAALTKTHGVQIKASGALLRHRLYQALAKLPPTAYGGSLSPLLTELVSEFTLADNLSTTTTSLLRSMCHKDDSILLGSWLEETDHQSVEEQLQTNSAAGSGALEHDPNSVFMADVDGTRTPGPLPLGVAVIDDAILLFGKAFPSVAARHRNQLLTHFKECISQAKSGRQQTIQINIFTAFLSALKNLVDSKSVLGQQETLSSAYTLIVGALASSEPMLRCAAGEAMGRMSQVGGDSNFVARVAQASFDQLKTSRDVVSKTGHSLVLGCLHRYVGGMGSGQHLQLSVSVLHQLTQDTSSPSVQIWALHGLTLIADSGGPMFRNCVENTLTLMLHLLVTTPPSLIEVHQCLTKCLSSLITTLGPELQDTSRSMVMIRQTCLSCCSIVREHPDAIVQSAAIGCLQQLQLFAPQYVSLPIIVPSLCSNLDSSHLLLRRAAANCLRQFTQREPKTIWTISLGQSSSNVGLEHVVLLKLDVESDPKLCEDLREVLFSLLTSLAPEDPMKWLHLCNGVLGASSSTSESSNGAGGKGGGRGGETNEGAGDDDEDAAKFTTGETEESQRATRISPRWPSKVFAVECSRKIYAVCRRDPAHLDLSMAKRKKNEKGGDYLVMHLTELVRTSFISATASVDQLKLAGYEALRDVINLFASTADPDFPGHLLLEQYQAQIGAALRPAFTSDSAPHVTAMACQVCSEWLGSGVSRNISDLKRVQQLLVSSLEKINKRRKETSSVYGESVATMETLAALKAWAELFIKVSETTHSQRPGDTPLSEDTNSQTSGGGAMELLDPHLPVLSQYWLSALRDKAYLFLPAEFGNQLPASGGTFYSVDVMDDVKQYYESNWSSLLHAAAIWLEERGLGPTITTTTTTKSQIHQKPLLPIGGGGGGGDGGGEEIIPSRIRNPKSDNFHLVLGLAIESLCSPITLDHPHVLSDCLKALEKLLSSDLAREILASDARFSVEILNVLHRLLLTSQVLHIHVTVFHIAIIVGEILQEVTTKTTSPRPLSEKERAASPDVDGGHLEEASKAPVALDSAIESGNSCPYALLKLVTCSLLRLIPNLKPAGDPTLTSSSSSSSEHHHQSPKREELVTISHSLSILVTACSLCTSEAMLVTLPPVLHMMLNTLGYISLLPLTQGMDIRSLHATGLKALNQLCGLFPSFHNGSTTTTTATATPTTPATVETQWCQLLQSVLMYVLGDYLEETASVSEGKGSDVLEMSRDTRMVVVVVLLHGSSPLNICPFLSNIFEGCVALFKECLHSEDVKLQVKSLQTIKSLFSKHATSSTSVHFIHKLGPEVVKLVEGCRKREWHLEAMVEATQVLEMLLDATPVENKSQMMALLIPLYVSTLIDASVTFSPSSQEKQIHDFFLQRVTLVGPRYPEAFRSVMLASPAIKLKVESAVRASQVAKTKGSSSGSVQARKNVTYQQPQQPSIKLKMDFKNFK